MRDRVDVSELHAIADTVEMSGMAHCADVVREAAEEIERRQRRGASRRVLLPVLSGLIVLFGAAMAVKGVRETDSG